MTEERVAQMLEVLAQESQQRYFVPQQALAEAFRVRGKTAGGNADLLSELVGRVLFLQITRESAKPAVCRGPLPGACVRVQLPRGELARTGYPSTAILEVLGPLPEGVDEVAVPTYLVDLVQQARTARRALSARTLASLCEEGATYSLSNLCAKASDSSEDLAARLAVAKLVQQAPRLFALQRTALAGEGQALYMLTPEWREAMQELEAAAEGAVPDQDALLGVLERHLGTPADLYRRSIDPDSGRVTLAFHFPVVARRRYAEAISAAAKEAGVEIVLNEQPHQGAVALAAQRALPEGLRAIKPPSLYHDRQEIHLSCSGQASEEAIADAQARFLEETGWCLALTLKNTAPPSVPTPPRKTSLPAPRPNPPRQT